MLFNIVADMLAILIERAKSDGQIKGVIPHLVDGGLSILQYADDTILFMDHDLEKARNLKLILAAFEQLSGLKINSIKVNCFVSAMLKTMHQFMRSCLVVGKANFLFDFGGSDSLSKVILYMLCVCIFRWNSNYQNGQIFFWKN
jgi:hypothetical protein